MRQQYNMFTININSDEPVSWFSDDITKLTETCYIPLLFPFFKSYKVIIFKPGKVKQK